MAQAKFKWTSNDSGTFKTYIIEGLLKVEMRKTQQSIDIPLPLSDEEHTLLNSIFGQKMFMNGSFIIMSRTDDYTDGTGSPSTYTSEEQRTWLLSTIFQPSGFHTLIDKDGIEYNGRIEELQIVEAGDDPVKLDAVFTFKIGLVPLAGQYSPT